VADTLVKADSAAPQAPIPPDPAIVPGKPDARGRHRTLADHPRQSRARRALRVRSDAVLFVLGIAIVALAIVLASLLPVATILRDVVAGLWTTPDVLIVVAVALAAIALLAGTIWSTTYLPTVWAISPLIPSLAAVCVVATYLVAPLGAGAAAFIIGSEMAAAIAIIGAIPLRMLATVRVAQTRSYWELRRRSEQLRKRLKAIKAMAPPGGWSTAEHMALDEASKQLVEVKRALLRPPGRSRTNGLEWVSAMGYVSLWRRVDRAEEALIDLEPPEALMGDALHDKLRLAGAGIKRDQLEAALDHAVHVIDKKGFEEYFAPTMQSAKVDATTNPGGAGGAVSNGANGARADGANVNDPTTSGDMASSAAPVAGDVVLARAVLREVRHAMNGFVQDTMEGLVRARNRLWRAILLTATVTFLLVGLAVLNNVPKSPLIGASVFFLVAAVVGLFNRLRLQAQADVAVEDFNLFEARLVHTPLISGLAGVAGVILVSVVPAASTQGIPALSKIFELGENPFGLLVAAAFGLAPDRIIGPLEDQTERLKGQLRAGKAAVETDHATPTVDTSAT
jgi:hypothetical protein